MPNILQMIVKSFTKNVNSKNGTTTTLPRGRDPANSQWPVKEHISQRNNQESKGIWRTETIHGLDGRSSLQDNRSPNTQPIWALWKSVKPNYTWSLPNGMLETANVGKWSLV